MTQSAEGTSERTAFRGATWLGTEPPPRPRRIGALGWARVVLRGVPLAVVLFGGLAAILLIRLVERPLTGARRPVTSWVPLFASVLACHLLGLRRIVHGTPMDGVGAAIANHASWLDIFALNASARVTFVAKSEVAGWPGIGWLARGAGTLFVRRHRADAAAQSGMLVDAMTSGHRVLLFPEGTSSDGARVLPFKSTLFEGFFSDRLKSSAQVQPVTVEYTAPASQDPRVFAWWGDMEFAPHLLQILSGPRGGTVRVTFHAPLRVSGFADRKALAATCEAAVRAGFSTTAEASA